MFLYSALKHYRDEEDNFQVDNLFYLCFRTSGLLPPVFRILFYFCCSSAFVVPLLCYSFHLTFVRELQFF